MGCGASTAANNVPNQSQQVEEEFVLEAIESLRKKLPKLRGRLEGLRGRLITSPEHASEAWCNKDVYKEDYTAHRMLSRKIATFDRRFNHAKRPDNIPSTVKTLAELEAQALQIKREFHPKLRVFLLAWLQEPRLGDHWEYVGLKELFLENFPGDAEYSEEALDAIIAETDKKVEEKKSAADSDQEKAWEEFKEEAYALKEKAKEILRSKKQELLPAFEAWKEQNRCVSLPHCSGVVADFDNWKGKVVSFSCSDTDVLGRSVSHAPEEGSWFTEDGKKNGRAVCMWGSELVQAWKAVDSVVDALVTEKYNQRFPNGCSYSLVNNGFNAVPMDYVGTIADDLSSMGFSEPYEFEPIDENAYERTHGREALNDLRRRFDYDNVGTQVFDGSRIRHYKWRSVTESAPEIKLSAMVNDFFLVFPGGSCIDALDLKAELGA